ncbi:MAG: hypothetical protein WA890_20705, partial [Micromonospora sp.]
IDAPTTPTLQAGRQVDAQTVPPLRVGPRLDAPTLPSMRRSTRGTERDVVPPGWGPYPDAQRGWRQDV